MDGRGGQTPKPTEKSPLLVRALRAASGSYGSGARGKAAVPERVDYEALPATDEGLVTGLGDAQSVTIAGMAALLAQKLAERGLPGMAPSTRALGASGDEAKVYDEVLSAHKGLLDRAWPSHDTDDGPLPGSSSMQTKESRSIDDVEPGRGALFLCAILSLILALGAPHPPNLRNLSVAAALGLKATSHQAILRLTNLAVGCIDAYTSAGLRNPDLNPHQHEDGLVALLWTCYAFGDGSTGGTCATDLLLQLPSFGQSAQATAMFNGLFSHPAVLGAAESVWSDGDQPAVAQLEEDEKPSGLLLRGALDQARPSALHLLTFTYHYVFVFVTVYLALSPESKHYHTLNPLVSYSIGKRGTADGHEPETALQAIVWWVYVVTAFGWGLEVVRAIWYGPLPHIAHARSLPLPPGSLAPLVSHTMIVLFVVLRLLSGGTRSVVELSYTLLAWSLPFLGLALFVFPAGIPALNPSLLHLGGAHSRPRTSLPNAVLAQRVVGSRLAGLRHLATLLAAFALLLIISLNGEIDVYDPDLLFSWLGVFDLPKGTPTQPATRNRRVSPMEGRSSIAVGLIVGGIIAWMAGAVRLDFEAARQVEGLADADTPMVATVPSDLDGWEASHGAVIADLARLERIRVVRFYASAPPLPSALNLLALLVVDLPSALLALAPSQGARQLSVLWKIRAERYLYLGIVSPQLFILRGWQKPLKHALKMA